MTEETKLAVTGAPGQITTEFTRAQIDLIKKTVCKDATDDELQLFLTVCKHTGLNPFVRQIHAVKRKVKQEDGTYQKQMAIQTGIDGYRLIAERTGKYQGQTPQEWCGPDGVWREVWLEDEPPLAARCGVYRSDREHPVYAVAHYDGYLQRTSSGAPVLRWREDPAGQLSKCAEALALRKAFPQETSGTHTDVEMGQADNEPDAPRTPKPRQLTEQDAVTVIEIGIKTGKKSGGGTWTKYHIHDSANRMFYTFDTKLVEVAEAYRESGKRCRIQFQAGQYGNELKGIVAVE